MCFLIDRLLQAAISPETAEKHSSHTSETISMFYFFIYLFFPPLFFWQRASSFAEASGLSCWCTDSGLLTRKLLVKECFPLCFCEKQRRRKKRLNSTKTWTYKHTNQISTWINFCSFSFFSKGGRDSSAWCHICW